MKPLLCAVISCRDRRANDPRCPHCCEVHLKMWLGGESHMDPQRHEGNQDDEERCA